jgi:hypothetical protein
MKVQIEGQRFVSFCLDSGLNVTLRYGAVSKELHTRIVTQADLSQGAKGQEGDIWKYEECDVVDERI